LDKLLLGQQKYAAAEPLLRAGYEGLKQREDRIPPPGKSCLNDALARLVQLAQATGQQEQAEPWRKKLDALAPPKPTTKP